MPETLKLKISSLKLLESNPRTIQKDKFERLCKDMVKDPEFIERRPILINKIGDVLNVYAGNQRVRAAKKLGWREVPCIVDEDLDEKTMRHRILADNMHAGEWDYDLLANEWELDELIEAGFNPEDLVGNVLDDKEAEKKPKKPKLCPHCGQEI